MHSRAVSRVGNAVLCARCLTQGRPLKYCVGYYAFRLWLLGRSSYVNGERKGFDLVRAHPMSHCHCTSPPLPPPPRGRCACSTHFRNLDQSGAERPQRGHHQHPPRSQLRAALTDAKQAHRACQRRSTRLLLRNASGARGFTLDHPFRASGAVQQQQGPVLMLVVSRLLLLR